MTETLPNRKTPLHLPPRETISSPVIVFVTILTEKRKSILCREEVHSLLIESWQKADSWCVGRYVVMPDHIHFFCAPTDLDCPPLTKWVRYWKSLVSRRWPAAAEQPIWQKSFWDTQLRESERYDEKWEYVRQNPVRKGLATNPDDWLYQGELNMLEWHN